VLHAAAIVLLHAAVILILHAGSILLLHAVAILILHAAAILLLHAAAILLKFPLYMKLGWLQKRCGHFREQKKYVALLRNATTMPSRSVLQPSCCTN